MDAAARKTGSFRVKWRWLVLLIVLAGVGLILRLTAAGPQSISLSEWLPWLNPPTVTLYYPDNQARFLVPVTRRVDDKSVTPAGAIEELLKGPEDRQMLASLFPSPTRLSSLEIQDGLALVGITTDTAFEPSPMITKAIARTLDNFAGIEMVRLVLNGDNLGESPVPPQGAGDDALFYTYGPYLVPVLVTASGPEEIIQLYLEGTDLPALTGLPEDIRLLEYRFDAERGLLYTSFNYTESVRQMALEDPEGIRRSLIGIIAALTAFPEVKAVMLDFEGHSRLGLGQCSDLLRAPQLKPQILNDEALLLKQ